MGAGVILCFMACRGLRELWTSTSSSEGATKHRRNRPDRFLPSHLHTYKNRIESRRSLTFATHYGTLVDCASYAPLVYSTRRISLLVCLSKKTEAFLCSEDGTNIMARIPAHSGHNRVKEGISDKKKQLPLLCMSLATLGVGKRRKQCRSSLGNRAVRYHSHIGEFHSVVMMTGWPMWSQRHPRPRHRSEHHKIEWRAEERIFLPAAACT